MTLTRRPSPFGELVTLREAMDRLFDDSIFRPFSASGGIGHLARLALRIQPVTAGEANALEATVAGGQPAKAGR